LQLVMLINYGIRLLLKRDQYLLLEVRMEVKLESKLELKIEMEVEMMKVYLSIHWEDSHRSRLTLQPI